MYDAIPIVGCPLRLLVTANGSVGVVLRHLSPTLSMFLLISATLTLRLHLRRLLASQALIPLTPLSK